MKSFLNKLLTGLAYLVFTSIILLNYMVVTNTSYLGAFSNNEIMQLAPPFRTSFEIYSYDLEKDSISLTRIAGLTLSYGVFNNETDIHVVKARGFDIYIVVSSIFVLIAMSLLRSKAKTMSELRIFASMILLSLVVAMNYIYFYESLKPVSDYKLVELEKPLVCERQGNTYVCVMDRFSEPSRIHLTTDSKTSIAISTGSDTRIVEIEDSYSETIDPGGKEVAIAILTATEPNRITYRRLSLSQLSDRSLALDTMTLLASGLKITTLIVIIFKKQSSIRSSEVVDSRENEHR